MKTACIPPVPVEPEFLAEIESVLADGESLAEFVEAAVRASVERRRVCAELSIRLTTSAARLPPIVIQKVSRPARMPGPASAFGLSIRLTRRPRFARLAMILVSESSAFMPRSEPILNA